MIDLDHIAIMKKSWNLIDKILSREKTIESRWYKTIRSPWNKISRGDTVYFKDSGGPVSAKAGIEKVLQFELNENIVSKIIKTYGSSICLNNIPDVVNFRNKNYCILIFLKNPCRITPFNINKKGFGNSSAWISIDHVKNLRT